MWRMTNWRNNFLVYLPTGNELFDSVDKVGIGFCSIDSAVDDDLAGIVFVGDRPGKCIGTKR